MTPSPLVVQEMTNLEDAAKYTSISQLHSSNWDFDFMGTLQGLCNLMVRKESGFDLLTVNTAW